MIFHFRCTDCRTAVKVDVDHADQRVRCPWCGHPQRVRHAVEATKEPLIDTPPREPADAAEPLWTTSTGQPSVSPPPDLQLTHAPGETEPQPEPRLPHEPAANVPRALPHGPGIDEHPHQPPHAPSADTPDPEMPHIPPQISSSSAPAGEPQGRSDPPPPSQQPSSGLPQAPPLRWSNRGDPELTRARLLTGLTSSVLLLRVLALLLAASSGWVALEFGYSVAWRWAVWLLGASLAGLCLSMAEIARAVKFVIHQQPWRGDRDEHASGP